MGHFRRQNMAVGGKKERRKSKRKQKILALQETTLSGFITFSTSFKKIIQFFVFRKSSQNFKMYALIGKLKKLRKYKRAILAHEYTLGQVLSDSKY